MSTSASPATSSKKGSEQTSSPSSARPISTYPYISAEATTPTKSGLSTSAKLPSKVSPPPSSYTSFANSNERARLLRSSRKLGRLLGATPVILGPGEEIDGADGNVSLYSLSTTDLHSVQSNQGTLPGKGSAAGANTPTANGEAGRIRGFILAMKALEGDVVNGAKKAKSKARGKENRERVKALAREAEEEREREREREREEKKAKRMSAPPTPTSFRLPSPSSIRPSFFSKDSFASVASSATGEASPNEAGTSIQQAMVLPKCSEESEELEATKRSGEQAQTSRTSRSKSRTRSGSASEASQNQSTPTRTSTSTNQPRKSTDSTSTTASRGRLGHRRVHTETTAMIIPPLPTASSLSTSTPGSAPDFPTSISAPTSPASTALAPTPVFASVSANETRDAYRDTARDRDRLGTTPSASAYASASEESDEGPRTPGSVLDGAVAQIRAAGVGPGNVDVMDVLEEYDVYAPPPRATTLSENEATEEDMGDDEAAGASDIEDIDDDDLDFDSGPGHTIRPSFVNPWDPDRSPIEPIFGHVSDRSGGPLDVDGRAARRRRLAKLTRYLGEQVPTELILHSKPTHAHVRSEPVVGSGASYGMDSIATQTMQTVDESVQLTTPVDDRRPLRRISVVASKRVLPLPMSPATPTASNTFFPSHPAIAPSSTSVARENNPSQGDGAPQKKVKRQRSLGKLVSLRANSEASTADVDDFVDHPSQIASTTSFTSLASTSQTHSQVQPGRDVSRKRGLGMGMLSGRERQLVEDEWTPEAYEDVVSRLRKLK